MPPGGATARRESRGRAAGISGTAEVRQARIFALSKCRSSSCALKMRPQAAPVPYNPGPRGTVRGDGDAHGGVLWPHPTGPSRQCDTACDVSGEPPNHPAHGATAANVPQGRSALSRRARGAWPATPGPRCRRVVGASSRGCPCHGASARSPGYRREVPPVKPRADPTRRRGDALATTHATRDTATAPRTTRGTSAPARAPRTWRPGPRTTFTSRRPFAAPPSPLARRRARPRAHRRPP